MLQRPRVHGPDRAVRTRAGEVQPDNLATVVKQHTAIILAETRRVLVPAHLLLRQAETGSQDTLGECDLLAAADLGSGPDDLTGFRLDLREPQTRQVESINLDQREIAGQVSSLDLPDQLPTRPGHANGQGIRVADQFRIGHQVAAESIRLNHKTAALTDDLAALEHLDADDAAGQFSVTDTSSL